MAQMGLLQTQQLEKQHVQQWQAGTLPKIQQPVNLYASSLCAYLSASLPLGCNANNTQPQTYLTSLSLMGQLWLSPSLEIVFISFIRQFNWMSKMLTKHRRRLSKITLCSSLRLCDYHCTNCLSFEGPTKTKNKKKERKRKLSAQAVDALWRLPRKYCHAVTAFVYFWILLDGNSVSCLNFCTNWQYVTNRSFTIQRVF